MQLVTGAPPYALLGGQRRSLSVATGRVTGQVRCDRQDARGAPQGVVAGQRLGSVMSSTARKPPVATSARSALVSTTGPRAALPSSARSRIAASSAAPINPRGRVGQRRQETTGVALSAGKRIAADHSMPSRQGIKPNPLRVAPLLLTLGRSPDAPSRP